VRHHASHVRSAAISTFNVVSASAGSGVRSATALILAGPGAVEQARGSCGVAAVPARVHRAECDRNRTGTPPARRPDFCHRRQTTARLTSALRPGSLEAEHSVDARPPGKARLSPPRREAPLFARSVHPALTDAAAPEANGSASSASRTTRSIPEGPTDPVLRVTACTPIQPRRRHLAPSISRSLPDTTGQASWAGGDVEVASATPRRAQLLDALERKSRARGRYGDRAVTRASRRTGLVNVAAAAKREASGSRLLGSC
jgi:hypothetical protein